MKKLLSILFLFAASFSFAQTSVTKQVGERIDVIGNKIWFINELQTDSSTCPKDYAGLCAMNTIYHQTNESVQVNPVISISKNLEKIKLARSTNQPVIFSERSIMKPLRFEDHGLKYQYPIYQVLINYDKETSKVDFIPKERFVEGTEHNVSSFLAISILIIFFVLFFFCYSEAFKVKLPEYASLEEIRFAGFVASVFAALLGYCANISNITIDYPLVRGEKNELSLWIGLIPLGFFLATFFLTVYVPFLFGRRAPIVRLWESGNATRRKIIGFGMVGFICALVIGIFHFQSSVHFGIYWVGTCVFSFFGAIAFKNFVIFTRNLYKKQVRIP